MKNRPIVLLALVLLFGCSNEEPIASDDNKDEEQTSTQPNEISPNSVSSIKRENELGTAYSRVEQQGKPVIYQVFTRLFGNTNTTNKPWGTIEENGVGKFNDFTDAALQGIKEFGTTHIWYTGVPHHAVIRDYTDYGISNDDPDVVKGRAGSPYAIKDYYNVNPDLAVDPAQRLQEFRALIERTHNNNMKVIIDIVPNHIARSYQSISKPKGVKDFGASDDKSVEYSRKNDFYYVPGSNFIVPNSITGYLPLNGETQPLSDGNFIESPAKWTGNGSRKAQPDINDWYETVKVNYGVRPDGSYDFPRLPKGYKNKPHQDHFEFWKDKDIPNSWIKFRDIVVYWTQFGVDGFRYDMAEMVPVEFWSYLNSNIKHHNPDSTLIAEVYNPSLYREFILLGKMDYLYDKVDLYDTLKAIMQGKTSTNDLLPIVEKFSDIDPYLLHFLENHDEQRIASPGFAGEARMGMPAMTISALLGKSPTMLYFAQALGEAGEGDAGFGDPTRTTIFDYWGLPSLKRWNNGGKFNPEKLQQTERELRDFYVRLLSLSATNAAFRGEYLDLHRINLAKQQYYGQQQFAFARWDNTQRLVVISNFSKQTTQRLQISLDPALRELWELKNECYQMTNLLASNAELDLLSKGTLSYQLSVNQQDISIGITLAPMESKVLKLSSQCE
jgi:glycosidase